MADDHTSVSVETLWQGLATLERERRFGGMPYPEGMSPFPGRLTGQGAFPGGDGCWREDGRLKEPGTGMIRLGGIMFLGNDFGTLSKFLSTLSSGYENPPTWRNLKERLGRAELKGTEKWFFTNAVLGLRTKGRALDAVDRTRYPEFARFCREFLEFQIQTVRPRLVVVLGPKAKDTVCSEILEPLVPAIAKWRSKSLSSMDPNETIQRGEWRGTCLTMHLTSHPYSDIGKHKTDALKDEDARRLFKAWETANTGDNGLGL
jgi:hypothetical protein